MGRAIQARRTDAEADQQVCGSSKHPRARQNTIDSRMKRRGNRLALPGLDRHLELDDENRSIVSGEVYGGVILPNGVIDHAEILSAFHGVVS